MRFNKKKGVILVLALLVFISILNLSSVFSKPIIQTAEYKLDAKVYYNDWIKDEQIIIIDGATYIFYTEEMSIAIQQRDNLTNKTISSNIMPIKSKREYNGLIFETLEYENLYGGMKINNNINPHKHKVKIYSDKIHLKVTREYPDGLNINELFYLYISISNLGTKPMNDVKYTEDLYSIFIHNTKLGSFIESNNRSNVPFDVSKDKIEWTGNIGVGETKKFNIPFEIVGANIGSDEVYNKNGYLTFTTYSGTKVITLNSTVVSKIKSARLKVKINGTEYNEEKVPSENNIIPGEINNITLKILNSYNESMIIKGKITLPDGIITKRVNNQEINVDKYEFEINTLGKSENEIILEIVAYANVNNSMKIDMETIFKSNELIKIPKTLNVPLSTKVDEEEFEKSIEILNITDKELELTVAKLKNLIRDDARIDENKTKMYVENKNQTVSNGTASSGTASNGNQGEVDFSKKNENLKYEKVQYSAEMFKNMAMESVLSNKILQLFIVIGVIFVFLLLVIKLSIKSLQKPKDENSARSKIIYETNIVKDKEATETDRIHVDNNIEEIINLGLDKIPDAEEFNLNALKVYISYRLEKGESKEELTKKLVEKGWDSSIISNFISSKEDP